MDDHLEITQIALILGGNRERGRMASRCYPLQSRHRRTKKVRIMEKILETAHSRSGHALVLLSGQDITTKLLKRKPANHCKKLQG